VNNISTCLVQQTPPPDSSNAIALSSAPTDFPVTNAPPRAVLIDQARQWATKAIAHAAAITSPDRTEECDFGCAVATHNLGEFYEMEGKIKDARKKYEEAASLAKSMGFTEGQTNARAGLRRLMELEKKA
jgi:tetratricopeptide (TPR) repeat protein